MRSLRLPDELLLDEADARALTGNVGVHGEGYAAYTSGPDKRKLLHRTIMSPPDDMQVDHINGNRMDNRRSNLRIVTRTENLLAYNKMRINNTSGVRGVTWCKRTGMWQAQLQRKGVNHFLGRYEELDEAIAARKAAEGELL